MLSFWSSSLSKRDSNWLKNKLHRKKLSKMRKAKANLVEILFHWRKNWPYSKLLASRTLRIKTKKINMSHIPYWVNWDPKNIMLIITNLKMRSQPNWRTKLTVIWSKQLNVTTWQSRSTKYLMKRSQKGILKSSWIKLLQTTSRNKLPISRLNIPLIKYLIKKSPETAQ